MNVVGVSPVGVRPAPVPITRNVRTVPRCSIETGEWKETRKRSVVILPGLGNSEADYAPLATALKSRGLAADIAAVRRIDWLRNALGLADINYWKGTLKPRPVVDWYFKLVEEAVERAKRETDGAPITLLAHSAGGWLGRLYLLNFGTAGIDRLVTLGTPHQPPPPESPMPDQTRGILTYVRDSCPGNYHPEINYVTVAGKAVEGAKFGDRKASLFRQLVGAGYLTVCGSADVWGDGIVPLPAAHLEGAEQITLEGVYHSPVGAKDDSQRQGGGAPSVDVINGPEAKDSNGNGSTGAIEDGIGNGATTADQPGIEPDTNSGILYVDGDKNKRPWYGSPGILELWLSHVADESELGLDLDQLSAATAAREAGDEAAQLLVAENAR